MDKLTNNQIVEHIAKEGFLKETIEYIARKTMTQEDTLNDLEQDIWLQLLEMDNEKLNQLYQTGQWQFFLTRIVINNIRSNTSPYYRIYRKFSALSEEMSYITDIEEGGDE